MIADARVARDAHSSASALRRRSASDRRRRRPRSLPRAGGRRRNGRRRGPAHRPGSRTRSARNPRPGAGLRARCRPCDMRISGACTRKPRAFDAGLGGDVGEPLERGDEFGPAVGIAGVVDRVDAAEDVARAEHFGPAQRERQHDGVARGHVGDRDAGCRPSVSSGTSMSVGQRGAADAAQVDVDGLVRDRAERARDAVGGVEFATCGAGRSARSAHGRRSPARARSRARPPNPCRRRPARRRACLRFTIHAHQRASGGPSPHKTLCSCIWKRTGRRVGDDPVGQFARRDCAWLGENSTSQRSCEVVFGDARRAPSRSRRGRRSRT